MPNPASDAARNPARHDTPTRTTPDTTMSPTHATNSDPSTTDQVDTTTPGTPNPTDDHTDQGQNQGQSTNRAGITMVRTAAGSLVGEDDPDLGMAVHAVAGGRRAA